MKAIFVLVGLFLALGTLSGMARLGETKEQLDARFGKALGGMRYLGTHGLFLQYFYSKGGFTIVCVMLNGHCVQESYNIEYGIRDLIDQNKNPLPVTLTLLSSNDGGQKWTQSQEQMYYSAEAGWKRDDGATATIAGDVITFLTPELIAEFGRREAAVQAAAYKREHPSLNPSGF